MNKFLLCFLFAFSFAFFSCSPETANKSPFADLEASVDADPSKENLNNLLKAYNAHIVENPKDGEIYEKAYDFAKKHKIPTAPSYLNGVIKTIDPGSKKSGDLLFELAQSLEGQRKSDAANVIYGNLIKRFPAHEKLADMKGKTNDTTPTGIIEKLTASRIENPDQYGINKAESIKYVDACEAFALSAPEDPRSPEFLFDAAEIAKLLKTYDKALGIYDWLIDKYPNYAKTPSALFIKAFTLENELGKQEEAKAAYEMFLEKYPEDDFADDAKFSLDNIGKSPDEVLKAIEAKNANQ